MRAALFCIFTYLDTRTLLHAAEVCRDWRFVARHPAVWTRVLLENARVCSKVPVPVYRPTLNPPFSQQNLGPGGLALATLPTPQLQPRPPKCSHEASWLGLVSLQPTKPRPLHRQAALLSLQFLAMLAQWCTQAHSLTLQNLKPRQRGKKESKEEYARSTR